MPPHNWPEGFIYSPTSIVQGIHPALFFHLISSPNPLDVDKRSACIEEQRVHPNLRIEVLADPHPLAKQNGLFASKKIPKDTELGEYVGEIGVEFLKTINRQGTYTWSFFVNDLVLYIHSETIANELTFINDFRGIQDSPNVQTKLIVHRGLYYLGYETTRDIEAGEELLVDYGNAWANHLAIK